MSTPVDGGHAELMNTGSSVVVLGAGQMGQGIAQTLIFSGFKTFLLDQNPEQLRMARKSISDRAAKGVEKGKWDSENANHALERLQEISSIKDCTEKNSVVWVIEAVTENALLKKELFSQIEAELGPETLFASNTSSISITELASSLEGPERFLGIHFMNPVPVMKLVEVIPGLETSESTLAAGLELVKNLGKTSVQSRDVPGFVVNRILMPMINEAAYALHENLASAAEIDIAMKLGTNVPMGPLELADYIGLDTCLSIMEILHEGLGDSKYRPCPVLRQYVSAKRLGRKNGKGFYEYN